MTRQSPPAPDAERRSRRIYSGDPRIWGRHYRGPSPLAVGLAVLLAALVSAYLAFAKELPFTGEPYELRATFANATTLTSGSPVRVAGVNVGKVTSVEPLGEAARVGFTVSEQGRPIHEDATVEIRPRLFLEGNFFLDLRPGSPSAAELPDGGEIPIARTATAVQLDEILTALAQPARRGLKRLLEGFGTALTYEPAAADDRTQDPDVRGETAAEALNQALRDGGPAGRGTAIVSEALLGERPHDLSGLVDAQRRALGELRGREAQLQRLITSFNLTAGALAAESGKLSASIAELAPTLEVAEPSLRHLSEALPPLRRLAIELEPGVAALPATIEAAGPWLEQTEALVRERELGGLARQLAAAAPGLGRTVRASAGLLAETEALSRCASDVLVPAGEIVIDDAGGAYPFSSGQPNYRELFYGLVDQAGESQGFDGNGQYVRFNAGGGSVLSSTPYPSGGFRNDVLFANMAATPLGTRPSFDPAAPPFRPGFRCFRNQLPDVNGAGGVGVPGDVGAPNPRALP